MKNLKLILSTILLQIIFISCEKQNGSESPNYIVIGNHSKLEINSKDTILIGVANDSSSFDIDVNNDGIDDFKLISYISDFFPSSNFGCIVECQNKEAYLNVIEIIDTTFYNGSSEQIIDDYYGKVAIFNNDFYSCFRSSLSDTIVLIQKIYEAKDMYVGDTIKKSDIYIGDKIEFSPSWPFVLDYNKVYESTDTVVYQINHLECYRKRIKNSIFYFGIKVDDKLGWIQLSVDDGYKIYLFETAVQE